MNSLSIFGQNQNLREIPIGELENLSTEDLVNLYRLGFRIEKMQEMPSTGEMAAIIILAGVIFLIKSVLYYKVGKWLSIKVGLEK